MQSRLFCALISALALFLTPNYACADMGLPMLAVVWPGAWILLLPIIILEATIARRVLDINWKRSLKISAAANVASTIAGIPIIWLGMLLPLWVIGAIIFYLPLPENVKLYLMIPFYAIWLPPISEKQSWMIPLSAAILCIPFFYASFKIETVVVRRMLSDFRIEEIKKWAWKANLYSYIAIISVLVTLTLWTFLSSV